MTTQAKTTSTSEAWDSKIYCLKILNKLTPSDMSSLILAGIEKENETLQNFASFDIYGKIITPLERN